MDNLAWLQGWYADQCDGDWEHGFGVSIGTLDNPGWSLKIDLVDTPLSDAVFNRLEREGDEDWFVCVVKDKTFEAHGGAQNLNDMVETFRSWALNSEKERNYV